MYEKNYSSEMKTANKYLELTEVEREVVISDIQRFLEIFPKGKSPEEYYEREEYFMNVPKVIPRQTKMCEYHVCAVKKWKYGLWESLRMYSNNCGLELRKDAEQWINKRMLEVKNRLIAQAVERYMDELRENTKGLRATLKLRVSQIEDYLSETENQVNSEIKTNKIKENLDQMEKKYQHFGDGLKDILSEFREECSSKISWIRESNFNFMKAIKLFSEGGNYSSNEAEKLAEQLDELDEDLEEEASVILRRIEDIQDSSIKKVRVKVDKTKEGLSVVMEELQFSDLVVGVITRIQAAIKRDTLTLKQQGNLLEARLAAAVRDTPGEHVADTWPRVFSELESRQQYLLRAVEIY
ncbi:unnamed protein product, partial [Timema podura]|nr:unnamed protein product [Timema podura]